MRIYFALMFGSIAVDILVRVVRLYRGNYPRQETKDHRTDLTGLIVNLIHAGVIAAFYWQLAGGAS